VEPGTGPARAAIWSGERTKYVVCRAGSEPEIHDCVYLYNHA
jgi:hypothetical protein